jgi:hypothetical protein
MTSKAYVPDQDNQGRFYIVDAKTCPQCKKTMLIYDGCSCDTEDAKWLLLRDAVQTQHDTLIAILGRMKIGDVYLEGLVRGGITELLKVLKRMEELEEK